MAYRSVPSLILIERLQNYRADPNSEKVDLRYRRDWRICSNLFSPILRADVCTTVYKNRRVESDAAGSRQRGIQLGDGIEELVKIEDEIIEMRGTHSLLINDIAALESANAAQFSNLEGLVVTLKVALMIVSRSYQN